MSDLKEVLTLKFRQVSIVLVSLIIFLLSFSVAQAQTSYIIVHALNPEGIEIDSVQYDNVVVICVGPVAGGEAEARENPTHGGSGGLIDIRTGVDVDTGDGSDGDLTAPAVLTSGVYNFRQVLVGTEITVDGDVTIKCQFVFGPSVIDAVFRPDSPPPSLTVYAGAARWADTDVEIAHFLNFVMTPHSGPYSELRDIYHSDGSGIDGGILRFYTTAGGDIVFGTIADGADGKNGGSGGNGGNITLDATDASVLFGGGILADGGDGSDGYSNQTDGGHGGDGGKVIVVAESVKMLDILTVDAGRGGHGISGTREHPDGGNGGNGGMGGGIRIEAIIEGQPALSIAANGGDGGDGGFGFNDYEDGQMDGGNGGKGGDGGKAGTLIGIAGTATPGSSGCGGYGGYGLPGEDGPGHWEGSYDPDPRIWVWDGPGQPGGNGGAGGDGGDSGGPDKQPGTGGRGGNGGHGGEGAPPGSDGEDGPDGQDGNVGQPQPWPLDLPDLPRTGSISGIVYKDEDGDENYDAEVDISIPSATVEAVLDGEVRGSAITNENGEYSISGLPVGNYTVEVTYELCDQNAIKSVEPIEFSVPASDDVNINVEYLPVDCGSDLWELWHYGPVFDTDNVVLVHGFESPGFGIKCKIGEPDDLFGNLHKLLQKKANGQHNVWLFEYADTDGLGKGYTFDHIENYASRLNEGINKIDQINHEKETGREVSSIITHSMGGYVSRKCFQTNSIHDIELLSLATGHFGFEFSHWGGALYESVKDLMPAGSFMWDLNFDYQYGEYIVVPIVGTNDHVVKVSSSSLIQAPNDQTHEINYPSNYYFLTIPAGDHGINDIQTESDVVFVHIMNFLLDIMIPFNQCPPDLHQEYIDDNQPVPDTLRPYISFSYYKHARFWDMYPRVIALENGLETDRIYSPSLFPTDLGTKGERGKAIDLYGNLGEGWIWIYHAHPEDDGLHIYYSPDKYVEVKITKGQSMIVKRLVGEEVDETIPNVALSFTPISGEEGEFVSAGSAGLYNKHSISIPPGSLSGDTVIYISEPEDNHALSSAVEIGPGGTTFSELSTITVEYKDSDIPAGHYEHEMKVLVWEDTTWNKVPGSVVDAEANTVSGQVNHLSVFAAGIPGVMPSIPGDINGNGQINLTDAILSLQVCAGIPPTTTVHKEADVNGDVRIGIEEVIYIMQKVAGVRD